MTRHIEKVVTPAGRKVKVSSVGTITDAARELGVTREHLSRVLHGHRASKSLLARYRKLKQQQSLAA